MSEEEIDWDQIPINEVQQLWSRLSREEKHQRWANASIVERRAIVNAVSESELEKLEFNPLPIHKPGRESQKEVENAKFELDRIHREQLEEEVTRIREAVENGIETSERRLQRRRTENIYVLVAIGIVTGFFTIYPDFRISTRSVDLLAAGIAGASVLFLFIKLNTASVGELGQETLWTKADRFADLLFQLSISGAFLLAIGTISISALNISLTPESSVFLSIAVGVMSIIISYHTFYINMRMENLANAIRFDEVQNEMFNLSAENNENREENVTEFLDLLDEYKEHADATQKLEKLRERITQIRGLSDEQIEQIQDHLDDLIEEKSKENKTDEELREIERQRREEQRKKYRAIIRGTESDE